MAEHNSPPNDDRPLIRRGRVDILNLYEVKEEELELLEKGPPTLQLNFAIFLFSTAITCAVALATATFNSKIVETIFIVVSVIGTLQGGFLLLSWWRTRTSIAKVVSTIRNRINGNSIAPQVHEEPEIQPKDPENDEAPRG